MGRSHTEVHIVGAQVEGNHAQRRRGVSNHYRAVIVGNSAYLSDRIENPGSGFVVRYVDYGNVCILFDGASVKLHIDGFVYRHLKVYVRQMVISAHFSRAGGICAVVENQSLFPFRKQGIQAYVNVDCSRAAEKHGSVFVRVGMCHSQEIASDSCHKVGKFTFTRTNVRNHLCHLHRICGGGRSRIEEYVSFYHIKS